MVVGTKQDAGYVGYAPFKYTALLQFLARRALAHRVGELVLVRIRVVNLILDRDDGPRAGTSVVSPWRQSEKEQGLCRLFNGVGK